MDEFISLMRIHFPEINEEKAEILAQYRSLVVNENKLQNITRILEPEDFLWGHVLDAKKYLECDFYEKNNTDLGSGCGSPGLIAAILDPGSRWLLVEAEKRKADFLSRIVADLRLGDRVEVVADRIEKTADRRGLLGVLVCKALGKVDKVYSWIRHCSTWNKLVLFKGPAWANEWNEFNKGHKTRPLAVIGTSEYQSGPENKQRIIIALSHVPRGTFGASRRLKS